MQRTAMAKFKEWEGLCPDTAEKKPDFLKNDDFFKQDEII